MSEYVEYSLRYDIISPPTRYEKPETNIRTKRIDLYQEYLYSIFLRKSYLKIQPIIRTIIIKYVTAQISTLSSNSIHNFFK